MKRVISVFLAVVMIICACPVFAYADSDNVFYEQEPNDRKYDANIIKNGYTVAGTVSGYEADYYRFQLKETSRVNITVIYDDSSLLFGVLDAAGDTIAVSDYLGISDGYYVDEIEKVFQAGEYYFVALRNTNYEGDYYNAVYSFGLIIEKLPNYLDKSSPFLKITTSAGRPKLSWNAVDGAKKYWIYRSTDGENFKYYDSTTKTSYTNVSAKVGTRYYYKIKAVSGDQKSKFSNLVYIRCTTAAPSVSISRVNGKPKLSWDKVTGAKKYWIYRSNDGKNYEYYTSTTKTSYTNSKAASGTKYWYKVKAVAEVNGKNVASAFSSAKSIITTISAPSVKIALSNGKPKLSWSKVTGADKYYIYRSTDGKSFSYYSSTTKASYTNTSAEANKMYYYKVKAICAENSKANSAYSNSVKIRTAKEAAKIQLAMMKNVAVDYNDAGNIIFTWDKVTGATGYKIMRASTEKDANAGKYELLATVTDCSYTDKTAKAGQYYYYRLIAVSSKSSYADSAPVDGPALPLYAKPGNLRDISTSTETRIKWDGVSGVDGYVILRGKTDVLEEMEPVAGVPMLRNWYYDDGLYHGYYYCVIGVKDMGENEDPIPTVPAIIYIR